MKEEMIRKKDSNTWKKNRRVFSRTDERKRFIVAGSTTIGQSYGGNEHITLVHLD